MESELLPLSVPEIRRLMGHLGTTHHHPNEHHPPLPLQTPSPQLPNAAAVLGVRDQDHGKYTLQKAAPLVAMNMIIWFMLSRSFRAAPIEGSGTTTFH